MDVKLRLVYKFNHILTTSFMSHQTVCTEHCNVLQSHNHGSVYFLVTSLEQGLDYARFDDQMALKIAEELEDWKERQQEIFRAKVMSISGTIWV